MARGLIYRDDAVEVRDLGTADPRAVGGVMSRRVRRVYYDHIDDDAETTRRHDFGPGVRMIALGEHAVLLVAHHPIVRDI